MQAADNAIRDVSDKTAKEAIALSPAGDVIDIVQGLRDRNFGRVAIGAVGLAAHLGGPETKAAAEAGVAVGVNFLEAAAKRAPNPFGKLGGALHQGKVALSAGRHQGGHWGRPVFIPYNQ